MADFFDDIKTFEEVRQDMEKAYDEYLKTGEEDTLWEIAHQVLSNALFVLNEDDVEDEFVYEFPADILSNKTGVIARLLNTSVGQIQKVATVPQDGVVWFITESGQDYDDDSPALAVWEIYNIANALYKMTEPLAHILYR
jgi:hypothetical protein